MSATDVGKIVKGKTTRAELDARFGPPISSFTNPANGHDVFHYYFADSQSTHNTASYIPIVSLFAGGWKGTSHVQSLMVTVSKAGIVEDYTFKDSTGGAQIQMQGPTHYTVKKY